MFVHERVGVLYVNLGGTAEVKTFVPCIGMKVFFVLSKNDIEVKNYDNSEL